MLKYTLLLSFVSVALAQQRVSVTIPQGTLSGVRLSTGILQPRYIAFKGIPYAEPPVGPLRFRNPVPHRGWSDVLDASEHRASCPHRPFLGISLPRFSEDCLFVNVYTPNLTGNRPVMVWIHGGAYVFGDGNSQIYGPDHFMKDGGVVMVSFNYRLGILGFLSTGDAAAQGNWALKDTIEALRWVKNNIRHFGGNPDSITIFGQSAGAITAHYLLLSQLGVGLFHRVIMQSGVSNLPCCLQPNPAAQARTLGQRLGLVFSSHQDLVDQLRSLPFQVIMSQQNGLLDMKVPRGFSPFAWVPSVEPEDSPETRFLVDTPFNLMNQGNVTAVPMIIGFMSDESLFIIRETLIDDTVFDQFIANPHYYVPQSFNLNPVTQAAEVNEVATTFRNMYLGTQHPHAGIRYNWTVYNTDHHFNFFIDRAVRYHARRQTQPIYYYNFYFDGSLNMLKRLLFLGNYPGAMHADDLLYLFDATRFSLPMLPNNPALNVRRRLVKMWINFATFGDPTPTTNSLITTRWNRYTLAGEEFLHIDETNTMRSRPLNGRLETWHNFQDRFNPSFVN